MYDNVNTAAFLYKYISDGPFEPIDCEYTRSHPLLKFKGFTVSVISNTEIVLTITSKEIDKDFLISGLEKMIDKVKVQKE